jgi:hypothetical protein
MPRNLNRRIEVCCPVLDPAIKKRIKDEILKAELADNVSTWALEPDGKYTPLSPKEGDEPLRAQAVFMSLARERSVPARTTVRREFGARAAASALSSLSPAMRAVQSVTRRRRTLGS